MRSASEALCVDDLMLAQATTPPTPQPHSCNTHFNAPFQHTLFQRCTHSLSNAPFNPFSINPLSNSLSYPSFQPVLSTQAIMEASNISTPSGNLGWCPSYQTYFPYSLVLYYNPQIITLSQLTFFSLFTFLSVFQLCRLSL